MFRGVQTENERRWDKSLCTGPFSTGLKADARRRGAEVFPSSPTVTVMTFKQICLSYCISMKKTYQLLQYISLTTNTHENLLYPRICLEKFVRHIPYFSIF